MHACEARVCEARLAALGRVDGQWIDDLKRQIKFLEFEKAKLLRAILGAPDELTILDKPIRVEAAWPEGRPHGFTDEEILSMIPLPELPP